MKIYDCFIFNDEYHILDIKLNTLTKYIDYFVIKEFYETHQEREKKYKLNNFTLKNLPNE